MHRFSALPIRITCALCVSLLFIGSATPPSRGQDRPPSTRETVFAPLTPAQQYAGEILSYLMKVVVGHAGDPRLRNDWATRGLQEDLDFEMIRDVMTDTQKNQLRMMVLDTNILPLARILYYYDKRLCLHKGRFELVSVFPAPEFVAIRLLLIQKIRQGEKVSLDGLMDRKELLFPGAREPTAEDLNALGLHYEELQLMRDVIASEPHMFTYLTSPFLVHSLHEVGALASDTAAAQAIIEANYQPYSSRYLGGAKTKNALKIVFLPSMTKEFLYGEFQPVLSPEGFWPADSLSDAVQEMAIDILCAAEMHVQAEVDRLRVGLPPIRGETWDRLWERIVHERISFFVEDDRPLVITPINVDRVVGDVCEEADFVVVLMGKNVYLTIHFDKEDSYPHRNHLYVDLLDVIYGQAQWQAEQVGEFIASRLRKILPRLLPSAS